MYRKIDVYVNGVYQYSTNKFKTCKDAVREARRTQHLVIAAIPTRYLTIYDYDVVTAKYSK